MFPERSLVNEFWYFVHQQAMDPLVPGVTRDASKVLDAFEDRNARIEYHLAEGEPSQDDLVMYTSIEPELEPHRYPTLQDALLAFLIHRLARGELPDTHVMWLRLCVLVVADVQREPKRLHVRSQSAVPELGDEKFPPQNHLMTVSDDWSCLSGETFDVVLRVYGGKG